MLQEEGEKAAILDLLQTKIGSLDESSDEWNSKLQTDWVIEVEGPKRTGAKNRLAAIRRPGDFRMASIIVSES